jgi:uncharacterized protein
MQFLLTGRDGNDTDALNRRMAVRPAHLAGAAKLREKGVLFLGAAIVDDQGKMIGSIMILNMADRQEVVEYLKEEPYVTGNVWQHIEIQSISVAPHYFPEAARKSQVTL